MHARARAEVASSLARACPGVDREARGRSVKKRRRINGDGERERRGDDEQKHTPV